MSETKRNDAEWARCKKCGHKLFRKVQCDPTVSSMVFDETDDLEMANRTIIEIKCHSCKEINTITL